MDRNALAELLQALESRRDAEERRREERYTALIERSIQLNDAGNYTCAVTYNDGTQDILTYVLNVQGMFWNDSQIALITVAPAVVLIISAAIIIKMKYWKNNGELKEENIYTNMHTRPGRRCQDKNPEDSIYENMDRIPRKASS
ncbi:UNVERIFIED_CONTAM: hypothetical protein FKN15_077093 [Acipenser sinensis]